MSDIAKKVSRKKGILSTVNFFLGFLLFYYLVVVILGGAILSFLGLEYDSLFSIVKFLSLYFFITIPVDFIIDGFFLIIKLTKNLSSIQLKLLYIAIDIPLNMVLLGFLESNLTDVSCSMLTAFLFCVIYSIIALFLDE